jgi:hypothetical protein
MKDSYAQLVAQKTKDNLPCINAPLIAMMSNQAKPSQCNISRTICSTRYLLSKAITQRIHVDLIGDNIWKRLPQRQHSDSLGEGDHQLILKFWDTSTTISPIKKDVKRNRMGVNTWEEHPIHYLQETQVN